MTEQEAIELLKHHSYTHEDSLHPKTEKGFLGMLRPFRGELYEDNFHKLMTILKTLSNHFKNRNLDREIIANLWSVCHLSRAWGIEKDGMLRRNNLINDQQIEQLSNWVDCISAVVMNLLDEVSAQEAFECYKFYLEDANEG